MSIRLLPILAALLAWAAGAAAGDCPQACRSAGESCREESPKPKVTMRFVVTAAQSGPASGPATALPEGSAVLWEPVVTAADGEDALLEARSDRAALTLTLRPRVSADGRFVMLRVAASDRGTVPGSGVEYDNSAACTVALPVGGPYFACPVFSPRPAAGGRPAPGALLVRVESVETPVSPGPEACDVRAAEAECRQGALGKLTAVGLTREVSAAGPVAPAPRDVLKPRPVRRKAVVSAGFQIRLAAASVAKNSDSRPGGCCVGGCRPGGGTDECCCGEGQCPAGAENCCCVEGKGVCRCAGKNGGPMFREQTPAAGVAVVVGEARRPFVVPVRIGGVGMNPPFARFPSQGECGAAGQVGAGVEKPEECPRCGAGRPAVRTEFRLLRMPAEVARVELGVGPGGCGSIDNDLLPEVLDRLASAGAAGVYEPLPALTVADGQAGEVHRDGPMTDAGGRAVRLAGLELAETPAGVTAVPVVVPSEGGLTVKVRPTLVESGVRLEIDAACDDVVAGPRVDFVAPPEPGKPARLIGALPLPRPLSRKLQADLTVPSGKTALLAGWCEPGSGEACVLAVTPEPVGGCCGPAAGEEVGHGR